MKSIPKWLLVPPAVALPSVGTVALALVVGPGPVVVGVVGFVAVVGLDSLAVAESAGSPLPQAAAPARRRSVGMRAGRVEVIIVRPGGCAYIPENGGEPLGTADPGV